VHKELLVLLRELRDFLVILELSVLKELLVQRQVPKVV